MKEILDQKGSILITAVVMLILLLIVSLIFSYWLSAQSKNNVHKTLASKAQFYDEAALQCMTRYLQTNAPASAKLTDSVTTDVFVLNLTMPDGATVEVSTWDIP